MLVTTDVRVSLIENSSGREAASEAAREDGAFAQPAAALSLA